MIPKSKLLFIIFLLTPLFLFARDYIITDFGAVSDTSALSTKAIQTAIDSCTANGGGSVIIPSGQYKTGSIILKSNVNLHFESGAILFGSRDLNNYIKLKPEFVSLRTQEATIQLIYAENKQNISITGFGIIDGQGSGFEKLSWNDEGITRPHLLRFITCQDVTIEDVTLKNSGCWMQHYLACDGIQIRGVKVFNRNNYNNDGLDLDGCRNVTVSDFISDSDDDGITLKSTSDRICENIAISNCVISSRCNAVKMGTESNGGFKIITINNCVVKPSEVETPTFFGREKGISGITLEIVDGGVMEGINIANIQIDGTESPIFIRLGNRARPYKEGMAINHIGRLRDVSINNIRAKNAGETGCSITGLPDHPIENIRLSDIVIEQKGGITMEDSLLHVDEKPKAYPEATMFGVLPTHGFFIRHAKNISFDGIQISTRELDQRPAFFLEDVTAFNLNEMHIKSSENTEANIWIAESSDIVVKGSVVYGSPANFVKLHGKGISNVTIINNVIPQGTNNILSNEDIDKDQIRVFGAR